MQTIDERLLELINYREQIRRAVDLGTYTDREVADTLQDIEEEIGEIRSAIAARQSRELLQNMTPGQAARELHKRKRNNMILQHAADYLGMLNADRKKPVILPNTAYTSSALHILANELPYLQAVKCNEEWYVAASPEALVEISRRIAKKWRDHNERGRELFSALEKVNELRRRESRRFCG